MVTRSLTHRVSCDGLNGLDSTPTPSPSDPCGWSWEFSASARMNWPTAIRTRITNLHPLALLRRGRGGGLEKGATDWIGKTPAGLPAHVNVPPESFMQLNLDVAPALDAHSPHTLLHRPRSRRVEKVNGPRAIVRVLEACDLPVRGDNVGLPLANEETVSASSHTVSVGHLESSLRVGVRRAGSLEFRKATSSDLRRSAIQSSHSRFFP